jgi:methylenetetrahydrofolate reductase (NADPH)
VKDPHLTIQISEYIMNSPSITSNSVLQSLISNYSIEVTARDEKSIEVATRLLDRNTQVYVANLPKDGMDSLVSACATLNRAGLKPVPHIVARNIASRDLLDVTLDRLANEANVKQALVVGGDRDQPAGPFHSALEVIRTELLQRHGISRIGIGCHPEGHPRVSDSIIWTALVEKVEIAVSSGLDPYLVSQFAFDAAPYILLARRLRAHDIKVPLSAGIPGPAGMAKLMKFALMCGVGSSLRALRERNNLARSALVGVTPERTLNSIAQAQLAEPELGFGGVHFFTFGSLDKTINFVSSVIN